MNWFASELHTHTCHSDAQFTPEELLEAAVGEELSLIALTDHNTASGWQDMDGAPIPVIKGIEWTTFFGHMPVLGGERLVDWHKATLAGIDGCLAEIKAAGGLAGVGHPYAIGGPVCTGCFWDYQVKSWDNVDYFEVWHETSAGVSAEDARAMAKWKRLLDAGARMTPTYGRDWHSNLHAGEIPFACTYLGVDAEGITAESGLAALRAGRTSLSLGPALFAELACADGKSYRLGDTMPAGRATLRLRVDCSLRRGRWTRFGMEPALLTAYGPENRVLCCMPAAREGVYEAELSCLDRFVRFELEGTCQGRPRLLALTAPVYIRA